MAKFSDKTVADLMKKQDQKPTKSTDSAKLNISKASHQSAMRLPMSCTLDVHTIGKLNALKQTLHLHNRDQVVDVLMTTPLNKLITTPKQKNTYNLFYKVYLMQSKPKAVKNYNAYHKVHRHN